MKSFMVGVDALVVGEFMSHTNKVCADNVENLTAGLNFQVSQLRRSLETQ